MAGRARIGFGLSSVESRTSPSDVIEVRVRDQVRLDVLLQHLPLGGELAVVAERQARERARPQRGADAGVERPGVERDARIATRGEEQEGREVVLDQTTRVAQHHDVERRARARTTGRAPRQASRQRGDDDPTGHRTSPRHGTTGVARTPPPPPQDASRPRRSPMPSVASPATGAALAAAAAGASARPSRTSSDGAKKLVPVTGVVKSSSRS